jgi:hypothetical protein
MVVKQPPIAWADISDASRDRSRDILDRTVREDEGVIAALQ